MKKNIFKVILGGAIMILLTVAMIPSAFADTIAVSPMTQKLVLNPGDTYTGSMTVFNPATNEAELVYKAELLPFYADEEYNAVYEETGDYNQIVNWVTLWGAEGELSPNEGADVYYRIDVPLDAPAGGQYFAIRATSVPKDASESTDGMGANIEVSYGIAYMVFAEITGTTERKGEIVDVDVPGMVFDGDIIATASIKNDGNVHGTASYTLEIFPLFSGEEAFTNAEDPETHTVLPGRTLYNATEWIDTPMFGIFNVVYTVEFEGVTAQVSKMVIKCPIWMLFIGVVIIIAIVMAIVTMMKKRK